MPFTKKDKPSRVVLLGLGAEYSQRINYYRCHEKSGVMKVVAVCDIEKPSYRYLDGYPLICLSDIDKVQYDYVLLTADDENKKYLNSYLETEGAERDRFVRYTLLDIPEMDFEKYEEIKSMKISIFSPNCWGGILSNKLCLEHRSPLKNLWLYQNDYIKLLSALDHYMEIVPVYLGMAKGTHPSEEENYPVMKIDDISVFCNHDRSFEEALHKWERRKKKINRDNMVCEFVTDSKELEQKFWLTKGFRSKVCFTCNSDHDPRSTFIRAKNRQDLELKSLFESLQIDVYRLLSGKPANRFEYNL